MQLKKNRVLLAGTGSGSGKTLITAGLLRCLEDRGYRTASFKCGPDYIDPMFHRRVTGRPAGNLDPWFCGGDALRYTMEEDSGTCDLLVAEGVMGYYDGIGFSSRGSTYEVAAETRTPVILIVNCKGLGASAGAVLQGFLHPPEALLARHPLPFKSEEAREAREDAAGDLSTLEQTDSQIRGVLFNQLPARLYPAAAAMARGMGVEPVGYLPTDRELTLPSRHLGLVTAAEVDDFESKIRRLAQTMEETLDLAALVRIAQAAPPVAYDAPAYASVEPFAEGTTIAVARDAAFCFQYRENIALLERMGCRIAYFSPLEDTALPEGTQGLLLSGGYPELYAAALEDNQAMRQAVRHAVEDGLPTIAECGGFLYLHETLESADGQICAMAGVIPGHGYNSQRLQRFGYVTLRADTDGLFGAVGTTARGHEFHYWVSTAEAADCYVEKPDRSRHWRCGWHRDTLYAGFPHLHFYACPSVCAAFVRKCMERG